MSTKTRSEPSTLEQFPYHYAITTRWRDNDVYGHVNNVVYYSWFDTAVNGYLLEKEVLDFTGGSVVGLVVETQCNYFSSVAFPDKMKAAVAVSKIGKSSVRYEVGIFRNEETTASAQGHFIHVYVDAVTRRPVSLPDELRVALDAISR